MLILPGPWSGAVLTSRRAGGRLAVSQVRLGFIVGGGSNNGSTTSRGERAWGWGAGLAPELGFGIRPLVGLPAGLRRAGGPHRRFPERSALAGRGVHGGRTVSPPPPVLDAARVCLDRRGAQCADGEAGPPRTGKSYSRRRGEWVSRPPSTCRRARGACQALNLGQRAHASRRRVDGPDRVRPVHLTPVRGRRAARPRG